MIVAVGLLVAFVLVLMFSSPGTRACRWRADRKRDADGQSFYACAACGAGILCADGKPPTTCLRSHAE